MIALGFLGVVLATVITGILLISSWLLGRKAAVTDADRANAQRLQIAAFVFLVIGAVLTILNHFYPGWDTRVVTCARSVTAATTA